MPPFASDRLKSRPIFEGDSVTPGGLSDLHVELLIGRIIECFLEKDEPVIDAVFPIG